MEVTDLRFALELALAIAGFFGAFILRGIALTLKELEDKMADLPKTYVSKDDFSDTMKHIEDMFQRIYDKLDGKADK